MVGFFVGEALPMRLRVFRWDLGQGVRVFDAVMLGYDKNEREVSA